MTTTRKESRSPVAAGLCARRFATQTKRMQ
jgi:hypothetical protein